MTRPVLLLGGTTEARRLADLLHEQRVPVVTSLAGRVVDPRLPVGDVRVGGFGGEDGLAQWLVRGEVPAVVDATHPFAEKISASAAAACGRTGVPLLRLERPAWERGPGDRWITVRDVGAAATAIRHFGRRVFLTTGRGGLAHFATVEDVWFLIRCVDPPDPPLPRRCEVMLARGPYRLDAELELIDHHAVDAIVTKNSGGSATRAKLEAARIRSLPVVMVQRPPRPDVPTVTAVADAAGWVLAHPTVSQGVYVRGV